MNTISYPNMRFINNKQKGQTFTSSFPSKSVDIKDKIKAIRKAIKQAHILSKTGNSELYKSAWKTVADLSDDIRKEIDEVIDNVEENIENKNKTNSQISEIIDM